MWDETPLDLEGLKSWLQARLGQSIDVHIVTAQSTVGFVRGKIDQVMRFESDGSHGVSVDGGGGARSFELEAGTSFPRTLTAIPDTFASHQLLINQRQHRLAVGPH